MSPTVSDLALLNKGHKDHIRSEENEDTRIQSTKTFYETGREVGQSKGTTFTNDGWLEKQASELNET